MSKTDYRTIRIRAF